MIKIISTIYTCVYRFDYSKGWISSEFYIINVLLIVVLFIKVKKNLWEIICRLLEITFSPVYYVQFIILQGKGLRGGYINKSIIGILLKCCLLRI